MLFGLFGSLFNSWKLGGIEPQAPADKRHPDITTLLETIGKTETSVERLRKEQIISITNDIRKSWLKYTLINADTFVIGKVYGRFSLVNKDSSNKVLAVTLTYGTSAALPDKITEREICELVCNALEVPIDQKQLESYKTRESFTQTTIWFNIDTHSHQIKLIALEI